MLLGSKSKASNGGVDQKAVVCVCVFAWIRSRRRLRLPFLALLPVVFLAAAKSFAMAEQCGQSGQSVPPWTDVPRRDAIGDLNTWAQRSP